MAFPRLNALSYWLFLLGGLVILSSFLADSGAASSGWTAYTPLSTEEFSPGTGQDLWILGLHLTSLSSLAGAINFIVTIHNMRTPNDLDAHPALRLVDRGLRRAAVLVLLRPSPRAVLLLDRQAGTSFFTGDNGAVLWQHMFWFFGHPEVYIMVLPAMGMLSGSSRSSRGSRSSATRRSPSPRSASRSPACSSGRTTCSRSGCPTRSSGGS